MTTPSDTPNEESLLPQEGGEVDQSLHNAQAKLDKLLDSADALDTQARAAQEQAAWIREYVRRRRAASDSAGSSMT